MRRLDQPRPSFLGGDLISRLSSISVELSITTIRPQAEARFAPEAIEFVAEASGFGLSAPAGAVIYDPLFQELEYEWEFGDPGATYAAPSDKLPAEYLDANSATGRRAAHVFAQPGTYTVTCRALLVTSVSPMRKVVMAEARTEVTVADPAWDSDLTVVVAFDGDFTGAPPGFQVSSMGSPFSSYSTVYGSMVRARNRDEVRHRILFKRGESTPSLVASDLHNSNTAGVGDSLQAIYIDEWGDPADEPFTFGQITDTGNASSFRPLIFSNIRVQGTYDSTTQTGNRSGALVTNIQGGYWLFDRCDIRNGGTGIDVNGGHEKDGAFHATRMFIHECTITDTAGYCVFGGGGPNQNPMASVHLLGSRPAHNPLAVHGSGDSSVGNAQGPVRISGGAHLTARGNYMFSICGWSPGGAWSDGEALSSWQPCIRYVPSGFSRLENGLEVPECTVSRNVLDGNGTISVRRGNPTEDPPLGKMVFEQNIMLGPVFMPILSTQNACFTHRNNVQIHSGLGEVATSAFVSFDIGTNSDVDASDVQREASVIYNNTWVALADDPATGFAAVFRKPEGGNAHDPALFPNVVAINNVLYAPDWPANSAPEQVDLGAVDATPIVETSYLGRNELVDGGTINTAFSVPAGIFSLYAPDVAVAASGTPAASRDVLGEDRLTATSGAV